MKRIALWLLVLGVSFFGQTFAVRAQEPVVGAETAGTKPAVELPQNIAQWLNFQPVSVQSLRGKGVVLYFYEEGCPNCKKRWPSLLETAKKYEGQPVMFIAVNSGTPARAVASYTREVGVNWPVIVDQDRSLEKQFDLTEVSLQNIFQTVVITPSGVIRKLGGDFDGAATLAAQGAKWKVDPSSIPDDLKGAWLSIELANYRAAAPVVKKSLTSSKPEVKAAAEQLQSAVSEQIDQMVAAAKQQVSQGHPWDAYKLYQELGAQFVGYTLPEEATKQQKELEADPAIVLEQKAAAALSAAKKTGSKGSAASIRRAKVMLEQLVAEMPDTEAAGEARGIIAKLPE